MNIVDPYLLKPCASNQESAPRIVDSTIGTSSSLVRILLGPSVVRMEVMFSTAMPSVQGLMDVLVVDPVGLPKVFAVYR